MRRLALVLVVAVFAALALVAVSHSPPGGEIALVPAENVGLESSTVLAGQVIYRDAAITNFDSDVGNNYLMPAVVRGIGPWNGCVATTVAAIRRGRDHRPIVPGGAHFGEPAALADTRRMHSYCRADNQKS